jgi:HEAT repeat protein
VRQVAIALAVFAVGMYMGRVTIGGHAPAEASNQEVKRLDTEVQSLRQTVALSLLDRQSATSRLEGISWSSRVERPDGDLVSALLAVLDHDPNINVRLSALDALGKFAGDPSVRKALVNAIPLQDSPLVQIALIDALVHMRDNSAAKELRKLSSDAEVNSAVRQRAQWGLEKLRYQ